MTRLEIEAAIAHNYRLASSRETEDHLRSRYRKVAGMLVWLLSQRWRT